MQAAPSRRDEIVTTALPEAIYGKPSADVVDLPAGALVFSPLIPESPALERQAAASLAAMTMLAPPATLERRYAMALALRALVPGGALTVIAPKDRGGTRLRKELESFGCTVEDTARRHHRVAATTRPGTLNGLDEALSSGAPRLVEELGLWSQPGVFSWDRIDAGTALLLQHLPALAGSGADFGCGLGILSRAVLASPAVKHLTLIDIDRRAIACAEHNVVDPRVAFVWADLRGATPELSGLDFVVMNAPFHDAGAEDRDLALGFVKRAAAALRKGGVCWLVANRHLPYEAIMQPLFKSVTSKMEAGGYKIYEAIK